MKLKYGKLEIETTIEKPREDSAYKKILHPKDLEEGCEYLARIPGVFICKSSHEPIEDKDLEIFDLSDVPRKVLGSITYKGVQFPYSLGLGRCLDEDKGDDKLKAGVCSVRPSALEFVGKIADLSTAIGLVKSIGTILDIEHRQRRFGPMVDDLVLGISLLDSETFAAEYKMHSAKRWKPVDIALAMREEFPKYFEDFSIDSFQCDYMM